MNSLLTPQLTRQLNKYGAKVTWVVSTLVLLITVGFVVYHAITHAKIKKQNYVAPPRMEQKAVSKPNYNVNRVLAANLMGNPKSKPKPVVENAPKTKLNIKLNGILFSEQQAQARAILTTKVTKNYAVGQKIEGVDASVKEIRQSEVLITRKGIVERIEMPMKSVDNLNQRLENKGAKKLGFVIRNVVAPVETDTAEYDSRVIQSDRRKALAKIKGSPPSNQKLPKSRSALARKSSRAMPVN